MALGEQESIGVVFIHGQHKYSILFQVVFISGYLVSSVLEQNQNKQDISPYSNIKIIMEPNLKYMYLIDSDQTEY